MVEAAAGGGDCGRGSSCSWSVFRKAWAAIFDCGSGRNAASTSANCEFRSGSDRQHSRIRTRVRDARQSDPENKLANPKELSSDRPKIYRTGSGLATPDFATRNFGTSDFASSILSSREYPEYGPIKCDRAGSLPSKSEFKRPDSEGAGIRVARSIRTSGDGTSR